MSGEAMEDLWRMEEWAREIDRENPLLAKLVREMRGLLDDYNYYVSGDTGSDKAEKAWSEFRSRWLSGSMEKVLEELLVSVEHSVLHGWNKENRW